MTNAVRLLVTILAGGVLGAQTMAQGAPPRVVQAATMTVPAVTISSKGAQTIVDAAAAEAARNGWTMSIAVVDVGGNLMAFRRMDGTQIGTIQAAMIKAQNAAKMQRASAFEKDANTAVAVLSVGFTTMPGGFPIEINGQVVGAAGISGGEGDQDAAMIKAGLAALKP